MPLSDGSERPVLHWLSLPWPLDSWAMWQTGLAEPKVNISCGMMISGYGGHAVR